MVIFVYCVNGLRVLYKWGARHKTNGKISHSRRMSHMQVVVREVKGDVLLGGWKWTWVFSKFRQTARHLRKKMPAAPPPTPHPYLPIHTPYTHPLTSHTRLSTPRFPPPTHPLNIQPLPTHPKTPLLTSQPQHPITNIPQLVSHPKHASSYTLPATSHP